MEKNKYVISVVFIILASVAGYFFGKNSIKNKPTDYIFDSKSFFDRKVGSFESIYVAGTLTGEGYDGNNTTVISCSKDKMECLTNSIFGISETSCQLGRLDAPKAFSIIKWDDYVVIATDEIPYDTFSCYKTTINIDRKSQTAEWVQEPINQSQISCADIKDSKIYKWTIEDPSWMKNRKK